jgi:hypothetical protein
LVKAALRADRDIDAAELRLAVLGVDRLACSYSDVSRLAQCLSNVPPAWCAVDFDLLVAQRAAERLEQTPWISEN